jgi:hypothetical protein
MNHFQRRTAVGNKWGSAVALGLIASALAGCASDPGEPLASRTELRPEKAKSPQAVVYYMHRTFRCATCLAIEKMTRQVLDEQFAGEMASGRLEFRTADFWVDEQLARKYDVSNVSVVVVNMNGGKEASHQKLDRVWDLHANPDEFKAYVGGAVQSALAAGR